jgi:hypothetical protein
MDAEEYNRLTEAKKAAAAAHDAGKQRVRERIARAVLENPEAAVRIALENLENQRAGWQQWSRNEWRQLLQSSPVEDLARMLVDPAGGHEAELSDSHPFAGVTSASRR